MTTRFLLLAAALAATSCGQASSAASRSPGNPAEAKTVATIKVRQTPVRQSTTVSGTLAPDEEILLSLKVTGRLDELLVDLGSRVQRGQVIARLTATDFQLRQSQAEAALAQARARLGLAPTGTDDAIEIEKTALVRQQQASLDEARRQRERIATFVTRGISAKADLETAESQLQIAEGRYQDAIEEVRNRQAILSQRRSELELAKQQLDDSVLRAPIDGVISERRSVAGEYRAAGTPIVTVVRQHPLRLQLAVPERAAAALRVGQVVRVTVEGDPQTYEGRVARLSPSITEGNRTLPIEAEIPNPLGRLRPGTFAKAEIVTDEAPGLVVPQSALVVFAGVEKVLIMKDGKAHEQRVKTGRRLGTDVEILDGVAAGDVVITAPGGLADGAAVRAGE